MGRDADAVRGQGRERHPAGVRLRRGAVAPMRELLGLLQYLLRAGSVVMGLRSLRHHQWPLVGVHHAILSPTLLPGEYVLFHRPRIATTTVFSHSQTVVVCGNCQTVLCQPTGGRARLTEGCSFRRKGD
ncbi:hypothetical protein ABFS82_07G101100 [Erythranthe guttata]